MDPDLRVREAITLVFRKFDEFHSVRQVHLWLRQEEIRLPAVKLSTPERKCIGGPEQKCIMDRWRNRRLCVALGQAASP
jgi:hypothetical protein